MSNNQHNDTMTGGATSAHWSDDDEMIHVRESFEQGDFDIDESEIDYDIQS